jgi:caffeoyl-CoA O-methyltransferase
MHFKTLFPNQLKLRKYFKKKNITIFEKSIYNFILKFSNAKEHAKKYKIYNPTKIKTEEMASNPISTTFLKFISSIVKPKNILEIGSFVGISAMELSESLAKNGRVTTLEKYDVFYKVAKKNFKQNKLDKKINIIHGDALKILNSGTLKKNFDIIFIDGFKEKYKELFIASDKILNKNGLIIVDNIFNQGDTLNSVPMTSKGYGVKRFLKYIENNKKYDKCIVPFYDGIMILKKIKLLK